MSRSLSRSAGAAGADAGVDIGDLGPIITGIIVRIPITPMAITPILITAGVSGAGGGNILGQVWPFPTSAVYRQTLCIDGLPAILHRIQGRHRLWSRWGR